MHRNRHRTRILKGLVPALVALLVSVTPAGPTATAEESTEPSSRIIIANDDNQTTTIPTPPGDWCGGIPAYIQVPNSLPDYPYSWVRHYYYRGCEDTIGNGTRYRLRYGGGGEDFTIEGCMGTGTLHYLGPMYDPVTPPSWETLNFRGYERLSGCDPSDPMIQLPDFPQDDPLVTVSGRVVTYVAEGEDATRPLAGARYELWYRGRDGSADSAVRFRPVRGGEDATGDPITGHLTDDGEFLPPAFRYPGTQTLPDGTTWYGCEPIASDGICAPEDVVLHVYPENDNSSVVVFEPGLNVTQPAHTVHLGHLPPPADHVATSETALAYRGVHNVKDLWPAMDGGDPRATIRLSRDSASGYDPRSGDITVPQTKTRSGLTERETALRFIHAAYGDQFPGAITTCRPHHFRYPATEACGWFLGLADFIATQAEDVVTQPDFRGRTTFFTNVETDLENCVEYATFEPTVRDCADGNTVEGRVAAALWDLIDARRDIVNGFRDNARHGHMDVLNVVIATKPQKVTDFWKNWRTWHVEDRDVMFQNTLVYTALRDEADADTATYWSPLQRCHVCVHSDYVVSLSDRSQMTWNFGQEIKEAGLYDVWVYTPPLNGYPGSPKAVYRVHTSTGDVHALTLDQTKSGDRWHRLTPNGVFLSPDGPNRIVLSNGVSQATAEVLADGLIIAPHE